jgi:hypothetical protein
MHGIWPCFGTPFHEVLQLSEALVLDWLRERSACEKGAKPRAFSISGPRRPSEQSAKLDCSIRPKLSHGQGTVSPANSREEKMTQANSASPQEIAPPRCPGYLMAPFGWAAAPLATLLERDASLYPALFSLSRPRMHLIALALAHCPGEIDVSLARLIVTSDPVDVLDAVFGRHPNGLKRALGRQCAVAVELPAPCRITPSTQHCKVYLSC